MKQIRNEIALLARKMRMDTLAVSPDYMLDMAEQEKWSYDQLLLTILQQECEARTEKEIASRIKRAGFNQLKYMQEIDRDELPEEGRQFLEVAQTLDFIKQGRNAILSGNPGTGKTLIATAIGIKACQEGMSVMFASVPHLLTELREAKSQKRLRQLEIRFQKYDLVICDEFGYVGCDKESGELLFNHLSLRAEKKSTIITTNLAFNRWGEVIKDKVLVAALVDRLTHKAFLVNMTGQSYRLKETKKIMDKQLCKD